MFMYIFNQINLHEFTILTTLHISGQEIRHRRCVLPFLCFATLYCTAKQIYLWCLEFLTAVPMNTVFLRPVPFGSRIMHCEASWFF